MKSALVAIASAYFAMAHPALRRQDECAATPAFILAGDSTTATTTASGGGWGDGFLSFLREGAWGENLGHNGATVPSFIEGGDWATVEGYVEDNVDVNDVYVTIQFGHNDQKPENGISLDEYQANLEGLVTDVQDRSGIPILVTPLTRRSFGSDGTVDDSLHDQRLRTIAAAESTGALYLDLNQASIDYVNAIGEDAAHAYNLDADDNTHLNAYGSIVFGRLVADLLLEQKACLETWFTPNETLSDALANGVPA